MPFKKWEIAKEDPELSGILAEECGISPLAAAVLVSRGHSTYADAIQFLSGEEEFADPFEIRDMDKAVERIRRAVDDGEPITVYGDYDCDGVTATVILYTYLSSIGGDVSYYIPERDGDGYGLNRDAVRRLAEAGTKLLITVDNGISALEEIALANALGIEVVVTDHHQPGEFLPDAVAVVDPHRKDCPSRFKELAGVGVAFKLIAALEDGDYQTALDYFADIVALGTVGDVVPLVGENRTIVRYGLRALSMSDNIGLLALMEAAGVRSDALTAQTLSFSLVPRINAAGRTGEAGLAARLLLAEDEEEAASLAARLDAMNRERQTQEAVIISEVEDCIRADHNLLTRRLLIVKGEHWNHGIIGIVCSKLVERYGKPVLLLTRDASDPDVYKGSARSVGGFHLFKALSANAEHLVRYGGHKAAAGFSLRAEEYDAFVAGMERYALEFHEFMPQLTLHVDKTLTPEELTLDAIETLSVLEPFGANHEVPIFRICRAVLEQATPLSGDKHQRLTLKVGGQTVTALWFGMPSNRFLYRPGSCLDLLVNADVNSYNGRRSVSLKIRDARPSGFAQEQFFSAKGYYEKIRRREPVPNAILGRAAPTREEAALVYRFLKQNGGYQNDIDCLFVQLNAAAGAGADINYCKLRMLLDILDESGLIAVSAAMTGVELLPVDGKADLTAAPSWKLVHAGS